MGAVIVTIQNGTVDYVTDGDVSIAVIDFDSLDPDTCFPEDVDELIEQVLAMPQTIPWRGGVIKRLASIKKECGKNMVL